MDHLIIQRAPEVGIMLQRASVVCMLGRWIIKCIRFDDRICGFVRFNKGLTIVFFYFSNRNTTSGDYRNTTYGLIHSRRHWPITRITVAKTNAKQIASRTPAKLEKAHNNVHKRSRSRKEHRAEINTIREFSQTECVSGSRQNPHDPSWLAIVFLVDRTSRPRN